MNKKDSERAPDELWWNCMQGGEILIRGESSIAGWLLRVDDQWVARSEDGSVRVAFDTHDEAQDFLMLICKTRG